MISRIDPIGPDPFGHFHPPSVNLDSKKIYAFVMMSRLSVAVHLLEGHHAATAPRPFASPSSHGLRSRLRSSARSVRACAGADSAGARRARSVVDHLVMQLRNLLHELRILRAGAGARTRHHRERRAR